MSNLDRSDEQVISNYPFTYESTRNIKIGILPPGSFLAVSVNIDEDTELPCRIKGISADGKLVICDNTGAEICYGQLYKTFASNDSGYVSFFLYNQNEVLSGFIFCKVEAAAQLVAVNTWYPNIFTYFDNDAFILLPECCVPTMKGAVRSFMVNNKHVTADLCIRFSEPTANNYRTGYNIYPTLYGDAMCINVYNVQEPEPNGLCVLSVNGKNYWVGGLNIILKSSVTSNLRVVYGDSSIILRGVTDAQ